jgi:fructose-1,6-bisphosphatase/sedoheptulose 1,7-bisphosphatase-like protein
MRGVRFFGEGTRTMSIVMQTYQHQIRFIDSIQVNPTKDAKIRF